MNFLAHLFLSGDDEALLVGNFIGDFVTNRDLEAYPSGVRDGVMLHRRIDRYTDNHPLVLQGVRRLYAGHGKYAPVIVDVYYDHLLAVNFEAFHDAPLPEFAAYVYEVLRRREEWLPPVLQRRLPLMIADDWLTSYASLEGLDYAFQRMKHRASKPWYLDGAVDSLRAQYDQYEEEFRQFFPDVQDFVSRDREG